MNDLRPVRVRFAPSPTGTTHLGNLRTALFNWLVARHWGGQFILRIEDTDQVRSSAAAVAQLQDDLRWLGLEWDEGPVNGGPHGPYIQSERLSLYRVAVERLLANDQAYYCDCSPDRLERVRHEQLQRGESPRYDNHCRDRELGHSDQTVIRLRVPDSGTVTFHDAIYGMVSFENATLGDLILMKSDGFPTYHLANVVDDHAMAINLVLRGNEWLSSVPWHLHLYEAFGWDPPRYAHLPLITDRRGRKLKKRPDVDPGDFSGYTRYFRVSTLRDEGYLPAGVQNYLALLGWNPGTEEEIFTPEQIAARFSLDRVHPSPAALDVDRLNWFNRQHMTRLSVVELADQAQPFLRATYPRDTRLDQPEWVRLLVETIRDELTTLNDVVEFSRFAFIAPTVYHDSAAAVLRTDPAAPVLAWLIERLPESDQTVMPVSTAQALFHDLRAAFSQWKPSVIYMPVRAALTGTLHGPQLPNIVALLGPETCRKRLQFALRR